MIALDDADTAWCARNDEPMLFVGLLVKVCDKEDGPLQAIVGTVWATEEAKNCSSSAAADWTEGDLRAQARV